MNHLSAIRLFEDIDWLTNSKKERLTKGIYFIQQVNSFHSHLKTWLSSQGVAVKFP